MFFLIFTGLFVRAVGFIMLLIRISLRIVGDNESMRLCKKEKRDMFGKANSGDKAITPAKGRLGFY
jgi:hypothetical protein